VRSSKKNSNKGYPIVKNDFQHSVAGLFEKQYHGTKCNNRIFIIVLFCALCRIQSQEEQKMIKSVFDEKFDEGVAVGEVRGKLNKGTGPATGYYGAPKEDLSNSCVQVKAEKKK